MKLLVLGGTAWLGSTVAATAVGRGHDVTCLARGESGRFPEGVREVRADRDDPDALDRVRCEDWDALVDVSRQPGQVRAAVAALSERVGHALFVSTGNVYADHSTPGQDETAGLLPPLPGDVMESMESYGEAKVACEQAVVAGFGAERSLLARAGLIGGPGDVSGRTGYWPVRMARPAGEDGAVLLPDAPAQPTQVLDVRDLAGWLVTSAERRLPGAFDTTGATVSLGEHLETAQRVAGHDGPLVVVSSEWLLEHGVEPWMGERSLPLWIPDESYAGFLTRESARARAAGLVTRPLEETLADVLEWELQQGVDRVRSAGLRRDDELSLLAEAASG
jgi:2'-hydroxyisoflavone reductase